VTGSRVVAWHGHRRRGRGRKLGEESGGMAWAPVAARVPIGSGGIRAA